MASCRCRPTAGSNRSGSRTRPMPSAAHDAGRHPVSRHPRPPYRGRDPIGPLPCHRCARQEPERPTAYRTPDARENGTFTARGERIERPGSRRVCGRRRTHSVRARQRGGGGRAAGGAGPDDRAGHCLRCCARQGSARVCAYSISAPDSATSRSCSRSSSARPARLSGSTASSRMLEHAEERRAAAGVGPRPLRRGRTPARSATPSRSTPSSSRFVLFHLPDAVDVVRHHVTGLRPGGSVRGDRLRRRCGPEPSRRRSSLQRSSPGCSRPSAPRNADPTIGSQLELLLAEAGLFRCPRGSGSGGTCPPMIRAEPGHHRRRDPVAGRGRSSQPGLPRRPRSTSRRSRRGSPRRSSAADAIIVLPTVSGAFGRRAG